MWAARCERAWAAVALELRVERGREGGGGVKKEGGRGVKRGIEREEKGRGEWEKDGEEKDEL
jgi:hypothetical protein